MHGSGNGRRDRLGRGGGSRMIDFGGRKELFRVIVGSHNYNMNTPESDKDWKVFVLPTFDDLYSGKEFSKSYVGETEDLEAHDIRKVSHLWWKANINFVEVLFTSEGHVNQKIKPRTKNILDVIFQHKHEIARMNLPYLYDACIGMHLNKKGQISKGTAGTQHLVDKFGYDTKQAMHSLRVLDFLKRFANNGFTDFKKAIWYDNYFADRDWFLGLKNGFLTKEKYLEWADAFLREAKGLESVYKEQKPNEETKEHLLRLVKDMVREELE